MCIDVTLEDLGLVLGEYSEQELSDAVDAYVLATYGEGATVKGYTDKLDGTVHICGTA